MPITFRDAGENRFRDRQLSLVTGLNWRFADRFDTALSYSFTRAKASYGGDSSRELDLIENNHRIDSVVHGLDLEVGTWLRRGLRLLVGYRLQYFDAEDPVTESIASVVGPDRGDTFQHAFTVGLTLTSDSFSRD